VELQDQGSDTLRPVAQAAAIISPDGIFVMAYGYGDGASAFGYGCPVIIEQYAGSLRVVHWSDINSDDAQEIINLEGAKYDDTEEHYGQYVLQRLNRNHQAVELHEFENLTDAVLLTANPQYKPIDGWYWRIYEVGKPNDAIWDSRFRPGVQVHVNRDDEQWGRIACDGEVVEAEAGESILVLVGGNIRANVLCDRKEVGLIVPGRGR